MKRIGNIKPPAFSAFKQCVDDRWWNEKNSMSLGEVYNYNMSEEMSKQKMQQFFSLIQENGYKPTSSTPYADLSLTACHGSIGEHDDPGYGLVALWLIHITGLNRGQDWTNPELYASRMWKMIRLGDIIVFNANKRHAWLSNSTCYMLMQTIRKSRSVAN